MKVHVGSDGKTHHEEDDCGCEQNICKWCGHIGDFWFDREIDENNNMNYRCTVCGKPN